MKVAICSGKFLIFNFYYPLYVAPADSRMKDNTLLSQTSTAAERSKMCLHGALTEDELDTARRDSVSAAFPDPWDRTE